MDGSGIVKGHAHIIAAGRNGSSEHGSIDAKLIGLVEQVLGKKRCVEEAEKEGYCIEVGHGGWNRDGLMDKGDG